MLTDYHVHLRLDDSPERFDESFTAANVDRYRETATERGIAELGVAAHHGLGRRGELLLQLGVGIAQALDLGVAHRHGLHGLVEFAAHKVDVADAGVGDGAGIEGHETGGHDVVSFAQARGGRELGTVGHPVAEPDVAHDRGQGAGDHDRDDGEDDQLRPGDGGLQIALVH